jgi:hypothetical protein
VNSTATPKKDDEDGSRSSHHDVNETAGRSDKGGPHEADILSEKRSDCDCFAMEMSNKADPRRCFRSLVSQLQEVPGPT